MGGFRERLERNFAIFTEIHKVSLFIPDHLLSQNLRYIEPHNLVYIVNYDDVRARYVTAQ